MAHHGRENVKFIKSLNRNRTQSYKLAIIKYVDLTTEEFTESFMGLDTSYDSVIELPFSMNLRMRGSVTTIKDQHVYGKTSSNSY
uniref:Uncharacterized protein n=1 Tax=Solanum lycopersicum TaxID=4081 RepID=A0A3Q7H7P2_SOLLC